MLREIMWSHWDTFSTSDYFGFLVQICLFPRQNFRLFSVNFQIFNVSLSHFPKNNHACLGIPHWAPFFLPAITYIMVLFNSKQYLLIVTKIKSSKSRKCWSTFKSNSPKNTFTSKHEFRYKQQNGKTSEMNEISSP